MANTNTKPKTKTSDKVTNAYKKRKYDRLSGILLPKGKKDEVKAFAASQGLTLNAFVNAAINEKMERDSAEK